MKFKTLLLSTLSFFLIINLTFFWEGFLGLFAFPAFIILFLIFIILTGVLVFQIFEGFTERFRSTKRNIIITVMSFSLGLIVYEPFGIIDFEKFEGEDLFIAQREGVANCTTILKLKKDGNFTERTVCFGIDKSKGKYILKGDTLKFISSDYYKFGLIKLIASPQKNMFGDLILFRSLNDSTPQILFITKNNL